jgi:hypothetical protein
MGSPILELSSAQPLYLYSSGSVWGPIYFSINPSGPPKFMQTGKEKEQFIRLLEYLCGVKTDFGAVEYSRMPQEAVYAGYALATEINSVSNSQKVRSSMIERFVFEMRKGEWSRDMMSVVLSIVEEMGLSEGIGVAQGTPLAKAALLEEKKLATQLPKIIPAGEKVAQKMDGLQPISVRELVVEYFNRNPADFALVVAPLVGAKETATVSAISPLVLRRVASEGPDSFARRMLEEIKRKRKAKYEAFLLELFGKRRSFRPDLGRILSLVVKKTVARK